MGISGAEMVRLWLTATAFLVATIASGGGGTKAPWTSNDGNLCSYSIVAGGAIPPIGNDYNPSGYGHSVIQQFQKYPYQAAFGPVNVNGSAIKTPFQFYISAKVKL